jgi:hypothetical protein
VKVTRGIAKEEVPASVQSPSRFNRNSLRPVRTVQTAKDAGHRRASSCSSPPISAGLAGHSGNQNEGEVGARSGPWHINDDRTIWAWDQPYIAGAAVNTMWMKPANVDLVITGRRLDGDSAPLKIQLAKDSTAGYIATAMTFPKAGCWEVTATAGSSTLTYITRVDPQ